MGHAGMEAVCGWRGGPLKTKFILIDYENVHTFSSDDLSVLN